MKQEIFFPEGESLTGVELRSISRMKEFLLLVAERASCHLDCATEGKL